MLCLCGFELYSRWVPLKKNNRRRCKSRLISPCTSPQLSLTDISLVGAHERHSKVSIILIRYWHFNKHLYLKTFNEFFFHLNFLFILARPREKLKVEIPRIIKLTCQAQTSTGESFPYAKNNNHLQNFVFPF